MIMKKNMFLALCAVSLLLGGCAQVRAENAGDTAGGMSGAQMTPAVSVETVVIEKTGIADTLTYNGVVHYSDVYYVIPEVSGQVKAIYFDVGQRVNAGDVLFLIDSADIATQIRELEASIATAGISIENAKINISENEMKLQQAETSMIRTQQLFDGGGVSQSELDSAKDSYATAQRTLESSRISAESAQASKNSVSIQLESARADLAAASVKSPVSGIVSARSVELGALAGSSAAYTIVNTDQMVIEAGITEQLAASLAVGDTVNIAFSSLSGESFTGELNSISPVTDDSGTYPVKISINNDNDRIKAGMSAEVSFTKTANDSAFVVSKDAVLADENGNFVYTAADGKAHKTAVETGIDNGAEVEITSGLAAGDVVIVKGQNYVTEGSLINDINDPSDDDASLTGAGVTDGVRQQGTPEGGQMQGPRPDGGPMQGPPPNGGGPGMGGF
jgi:RND family efflux transporter MFP subunit